MREILNLEFFERHHQSRVADFRAKCTTSWNERGKVGRAASRRFHCLASDQEYTARATASLLGSFAASRRLFSLRSEREKTRAEILFISILRLLIHSGLLTCCSSVTISGAGKESETASNFYENLWRTKCRILFYTHLLEKFIFYCFPRQFVRNLNLNSTKLPNVPKSMS